MPPSFFIFFSTKLEIILLCFSSTSFGVVIFELILFLSYFISGLSRSILHEYTIFFEFETIEFVVPMKKLILLLAAILDRSGSKSNKENKGYIKYLS